MYQCTDPTCDDWSLETLSFCWRALILCICTHFGRPLFSLSPCVQGYSRRRGGCICRQGTVFSSMPVRSWAWVSRFWISTNRLPVRIPCFRPEPPARPTRSPFAVSQNCLHLKVLGMPPLCNASCFMPSRLWVTMVRVLCCTLFHLQSERHTRGSSGRVLVGFAFC